VRLKIEDRLRILALSCRIDTGSSFSLGELSTLLCDLKSLSPTEFRVIKYIIEFCDRAAYADRVDPYKIKEARAIGEQVIRVIDNRLDIS
jgi:hypothetical protein